ncbi:MAG: type III PLP-dependent enzyme [Burkholderiales bacterium]|nr:type III PLP-dependent enzyme [Burkholderiales bacterium]
MTVRSALTQRLEQEHPLDTHPETRVDFDRVQLAARQRYDRPFLLVDPTIVRTKARRFKAVMPRVQPHYAVKANPHPTVLRTLIEEGVGFEIASIAELDLLLELGVPAEEIYYSNPVKSRAYLEYAAAKGVQWYVLDCVEELRKIVAVKPDASLYLRIEVSNVGSDWPLSGKFGAPVPDVDGIIDEAVRLHADLAGVTFHVGSQCRNPENWRAGMESAKRVFRSMKLKGLRPRLLNLGGGYPVRHTKPIPSIEVIGEVVNRGLAAFGPEVRVMAEPGRFLVSDAAWFVCQVVGTTTRGGKRWAYLDAGMFGGIIETTEGLQYDVVTERHGKLVPYTVAGPTCDSVDVVMRDQLLPDDLQADDFAYIPNAGAYTTAYASNFNGFPLPEVRFVGVGS